MDQEKLFYDDVYDALNAVVDALGGKVAVGVLLRPEWETKPGQAEAWVRDCLNRNHRTDFKPQQLIWLLSAARKIDCHVGMYHFADECDYKRPAPVDPETEMARLQRETLRMSKDLMAMMGKYEHLVKLHDGSGGNG